jgi:tripeptidyl-peptidase-2
MYIQMIAGTEETTNVINVVPGSSLEVCLAQFWSSLGDTVVDLEVIFHSLIANSSEVTIHGAKNWSRVDVWSPTRVENLSPAASLNILRQPVRPTISE